jgi:spermidine synthase
MVSTRRFFVLLYASSGAAALVYEVAWTRLLTLQLGHTVAAASTVLAAFMGGLAVGAWAAGACRPRERSASSLRAYAVLELIVAASALLLPMALHASAPALAWAYADGEAPIRFAVVRVAISLALLGVPAAAMGATFPIAADWLTRAKHRGSRPSGGPALDSTLDAGVLYAANTAGAALGAVASGFWLIPILGLRGTTWVGVSLNLAAAAGAFWLASFPDTSPVMDATRTDERSPTGAKKKKSVPKTQWPSLEPRPRLAAAAAAVSGFAALVYEVVWTRLLALVLGPTTYAFATMAAAFVAGLAIGSAVGTRVARWTASPATWLAGMLMTSAVAASAAAWFAATRVPLIVAGQVTEPEVVFTRVIASQAFGIALLLLPMTMALGAAFPLALAAAGGGGGIARATARVYAMNTVGAIIGALTAGFFLVPQFGLRASIRDAAGVEAVGGALCLAAALASRDGRSGLRRLGVPAGAGLTALLVIAAMPSWDRALLASGAYKYAPYVAGADLDIVLRAGTIEYYREGAAATVSVRQLTGTRSMAIDGKVDASDAGDMLTQRLLGLLPVLIHGDAQEVCIIGLGSGVTLGSALAAGTVRHADVVELSPEVVEASHFFDRENGRALAQPGVRLIVGDGRSHLLLTPRRYDVIVSEPSNPWMSGVATLFTREFFEAARARLKPRGLICQWAHTYDISADDLRSIVRTFTEVFPQSTFWLVGGGDLLLIGSGDSPIAPRLASVEPGCRKGAVSAALSDVGIADGSLPFALLSLFAGGPRELEQFGAGALVQTDDRTALEYSAPRGIYGRSRDDNAATIRALGAERPPAVRDAFDRATDTGWTSRGVMDLKAQAFATAYEAFHQAAALNSRNSAALSGLSDAAGGSNKLLEERDWLRAASAREPANANVWIELSRVLAVTGDARGSIEAASTAVRLAPSEPRATEQLASVLADIGDGAKLARLADEMVVRFPDRIDSRYYRATALYLGHRSEEAVTAAQEVVAAQPSHARAQSLLGAACASIGRLDCALAAFRAAVRASPRDPSNYVNAGVFSLQAGNSAAAEDYFASALTIDPSSKPARDGLTQARGLLDATRDPR